MAGSNPYKRPRRSEKRTILFYGEGSAEEVFLKHLKKLYAQNAGVTATVKGGQGGTADRIVEMASRHFGAYDKRIVVLDNDKSKGEMEKARRIAKFCKIHLIENTPCLEALLLRILNDGKIAENKSSAECKKEFEKKHICKKRRCDKDEYEKIFTKKVLDGARKKIEELDEVIELMEGKGIK